MFKVLVKFIILLVFKMFKNCYLYSYICDDVFLNEYYKFLM